MSTPSTAIQPNDGQMLECIFDACIALSYYSMPCTLVYFLFSYKERIPIKYKLVVIIIGMFICMCGTTHVIMIFTKLFPSVSLNDTVLIVFKGITAVISFVTSIILWYLIPLFVNFGFTSLDLHIEYLKLRNYLQELKQYTIMQIKEKEEVLKQLHYVYSIVLILHSLRPLSRNFSLTQTELQFMLTSPVPSAASSLSPADIASGSAFTSYFSISGFFATIPSSLASLILRTSYMMEKNIASSSLPTLYPVAFKDFKMDNNNNNKGKHAASDSGSQSVPASPLPLASATLLTDPTVATGTATPKIDHHRHLLRTNRANSSFILAAEPATHTTLVVSHESTTPQQPQQQHSDDTATATATTATAASGGGAEDRNDTDDEEDGKAQKMFVSPSAIHMKYTSSKSNTSSSSSSSSSSSGGGSAVAAATSPTSPPFTATSSAPSTPIALLRPSINTKPNTGNNMVELTSARVPVVATRMNTTSDSPLQTNVTSSSSGGADASSGSLKSGSIQRLSLDECLNNIIAVEVLKDICSRQFCIENIMFLIDARKYRLHMGSVNERRHYSRHIYDTYVTQGSLYEVNISSQARHYIAQNNKYGAPDLFTPAEKEIMKLMEDNVFQRIFTGMKEFQLVCTMPTFFKDMSMGMTNTTTPANVAWVPAGAKNNDANLLSNTKLNNNQNNLTDESHEIVSPGHLLDEDDDDAHQHQSSNSDRFRQLLSNYSLKVNNYSMNKSSTTSSKSDKTVTTSASNNEVTKAVSPSTNNNTSNVTVIATTTTITTTNNNVNAKDNGGSDFSPLLRANLKLAQSSKLNNSNNINKGDMHNVLEDDLV